MSIKQDLTALKSSAKTWYDDYEKGISALDSRTNADLYTSLSELYKFHKDWTKEDKKAEYKELFDNTYITNGGKEAGTGYANLIKLVFFPNADKASDYRSNITKWSGAIMQAKRKKPPAAAAAMETALKTGTIAGLYKKYVLANSGKSGSADDKLKKGKSVLEKIGGVMVKTDDLNSASLGADKYGLALVRMSADGTNLEVLKTVADEESNDTIRYIESEAPIPVTLTKLIDLMRFSDAASTGTNNRTVIINNTDEGCFVMAGELSDNAHLAYTPVARVVMPKLEIIKTGVYVIQNDQVNAIKHMASSAPHTSWKWDLSSGKNPVLTVSGKNVATWKLDQVTGNDPYNERDGIAYNKTSMTVQLASDWTNQSICDRKTDLKYDDLKIKLPKAFVKEYLDWYSNKKNKEEGNIEWQFTADKAIFNAEVRTQIFTHGGAAVKIECRFIQDAEYFFKVLRSMKSNSKDGTVILSVGSEMIRLETTGRNNEEWSVFIPRKTGVRMETGGLCHHDNVGDVFASQAKASKAA